jgi:hypothetical protein
MTASRLALLLALLGGCFDKPAAVTQQALHFNMVVPVTGAVVTEPAQNVTIPLRVDASTGVDPMVIGKDGLFEILDADGTSLAVQVEPANDNPQIIWVHVPRVVAGASLIIRRGAPLTPPQPGWVWPPRYTGVWHLGSASPSQADDAGSTHPAVSPTDGLVVVPGELAGGVQLEPAQRFDVDRAPGAKSFTLAAWIRPNVVGPGGARTAIAIVTSNLTLVGLGLDAMGRPGAVGPATPASASLIGSQPLTPANWHQLVLVHDEGLGATNTLYVNGAAVATAAAIPWSPPLTGVTLRLGNNQAQTAPLLGAIDEVHVESSAHTAGEVMFEYLAQAQDGGLVTYDPATP